MFKMVKEAIKQMKLRLQNLGIMVDGRIEMKVNIKIW
jgi:hypothetical protein